MEYLTKLAANKIEAQKHYEMLGMTNTYGRTPEETVMADIEFQKARIAAEIACSQYDAAIRLSVSSI